MSFEQEFRAVKRLTKILETLDASARQRVLAFVAAERPQAKQATPGPQTITAANGAKLDVKHDADGGVTLSLPAERTFAGGKGRIVDEG